MGDKATGEFRMKRIPEPELMDSPRQAAAYAGFALDSAYWLFMQLFNRYFPGLSPKSTILNLGCGPAAIPLRLAAGLKESLTLTAVSSMQFTGYDLLG